MDKAWIDKQRAEVQAQKDQHLAQVNACSGALEMLAMVEAELQKSKKQPMKVKD